MSAFGRFYLDKEKDMIVDLSLQDAHLKYRIRTPNHHSGNLISNVSSTFSASEGPRSPISIPTVRLR